MGGKKSEMDTLCKVYALARGLWRQRGAVDSGELYEIAREAHLLAEVPEQPGGAYQLLSFVALITAGAEPNRVVFNRDDLKSLLKLFKRQQTGRITGDEMMAILRKTYGI